MSINSFLTRVFSFFFYYSCWCCVGIDPINVVLHQKQVTAAVPHSLFTARKGVKLSKYFRIVALVVVAYSPLIPVKGKNQKVFQNRFPGAVPRFLLPMGKGSSSKTRISK